MKNLTLFELANIVKGQLIGNDTKFNGVSSDSRTIKSGELFVAIEGPNFNGHHFIAQAKESGAVAALVHQPITTDLPIIQVKDTLVALGELAAFWRQQFNIPVIALTGSCGKTTVKEMIRSILNEVGPTLASPSSLNNNIGLPLTLLKITPQHQFAVIEMGANHPGEINYLTRITKPTICFINNIAPAHLEGFGSIEGVAQAKSEIFNGLANDGVALINVDDHFAAKLTEKLKNQAKIITFGMKNAADFSATDLLLNNNGNFSFKLHTPAGQISIELPLLGEHNVLNAVAAAAATCSFATPEQIKEGLEKMQAVPGRLVVKESQVGARIFDDTYNANPSSVRAAITVLAKCKGERVLILGDMGELGPEAENLHSEIGHFAKEMGIQHLYACGKLSRATIKAFGNGGYHFDDKNQLNEAVRAILKPEMTILVKGSRSAKMEQVVAALVK